MKVESAYYSACVACRICAVTARMLDYWVTTYVIKPEVFECHQREESKGKRKSYRLFDYETLVHIKIVKELRNVGVTLNAIHFVITKLRESHGRRWHSKWLVTDGKDVYELTTSPAIVKSLAKAKLGRLVFSVIALGNAAAYVKAQLKDARAFHREPSSGNLRTWKSKIVSA